MIKRRLLAASILTLAAAPLAASAHHSFAMFDRNKTDTITGTVKEFEMINPHAWLRVMVAGPQGREAEWSMEMGGPGQLQRDGWTQTSVAPGDKVTVTMHPLRDGSYGGQLISVKLANGKVLGDRQPPPRND